LSEEDFEKPLTFEKTRIPKETSERLRLGLKSKDIGNAEFKKNDFKKAIKMYRKSRDLLSTILVEHPEALETLISVYLNTSFIFYKQKEFEKAMFAASRIFSLTENPPLKAYYRRGQSLWPAPIMKFAQAFKDFEFCLKQEPGNKEFNQAMQEARLEKFMFENHVESYLKRARSVDVKECVTWNFDGGVYQGQRNGDMKHGVGTIRFEDCSHYTGEWKDDKFHGWGESLWPPAPGCENGHGFTGEFVNHNRKYGKEIFKDKTIYIGDFEGF